ncbi:hypothetical protein [Streptomyces sp. BH104]|uniref:hypothetical protein n=1 Tax=Streptomyces sp. BH104 TaxID=3410407 RepID=UPI003BB4C333
MILVHLSATWPRVLKGELSAAEASLGSWYNVSDAKIEACGDVLLGIYDNTVVSAFDLTGPAVRDAEGRVTFTGSPSQDWAHLVGMPNPGKAWGVRGMARPIQYLETTALTGALAPIEDDRGLRRAVVGDVALSVDADGNAVVSVPAGRTVTVVTREA